MEEDGGGRGEIMNTQEVSSALVDRAGIIRLNLYSGQGAFHRGGREGGISFFPIMHQQQDPNWHRGLGSFSRDKCPAFRPDSLRGKPASGPPFTAPVVCLRTRAGIPRREQPPHPSTPSPDSPPTLQLTRRHGWWWTLLLCCFSAASSFPASWRPRGAVNGAVPQRPRRRRGAPKKGYENSCRRMKNSCGVTVYLSIPDSSSPPLCPLCLSFCADDVPVGAAHGCFGVGWWGVGGWGGVF